jgi:tripartite-type tricarboxylate transporter receptor subunit TctC
LVNAPACPPNKPPATQPDRSSARAPCGILAPHGAAPAAIEHLNNAVAISQRDMNADDTPASEGAELPTMTLQQLGAYLRSEITEYADLSKLSLRLE